MRGGGINIKLLTKLYKEIREEFFSKIFDKNEGYFVE